MQNRPNYRKLYADMIEDKYPEKVTLCTSFFKKKKDWIALDVILVNMILFGSSPKNSDIKTNSKHRAYDTESILKILEYQYDNKLSNSEIANKFGMSRNTISKWKKVFEHCTCTENYIKKEL